MNNEVERITLSLQSMGGAQEWFLDVKTGDTIERNWIIGRKDEVKKVIDALRKL